MPSPGSLESVTTDESDISDPFDTARVNSINVSLVVANVGGTLPTLDVALETTADGTNFYEVDAFPQQTATGTTARVFGPLGSSSRWSWTVAGTLPSFTFHIAAAPAPVSVDQPYITATELRAAVTGLSDTAKFSDALLARLIARFEQMAENYRGVAFTPRAATSVLTIPFNFGPGSLLLPHSRVSSLTALSYDTGTAPAFGDVLIFDGYRLQLPDSAWWPGGTIATVGYTHGYSEPPAALIDACAEFVRAEAIARKGSQPRNVTGERTDLGWIPEPTADPSKGRPTRWVVVNEILNELPDERLPGIA